MDPHGGGHILRSPVPVSVFVGPQGRRTPEGQVGTKLGWQPWPGQRGRPRGQPLTTRGLAPWLPGRPARPQSPDRRTGVATLPQRWTDGWTEAIALLQSWMDRQGCPTWPQSPDGWTKAAALLQSWMDRWTKAATPCRAGSAHASPRDTAAGSSTSARSQGHRSLSCEGRGDAGHSTVGERGCGSWPPQGWQGSGSAAQGAGGEQARVCQRWGA